jgi:hypothetical protein
MKRLLVILFFYPTLVFSQVDTCFTSEEIQDISFTLDSLFLLNDINDSIIEQQKLLISDQKDLIKLDSLQLQYKTKQIALLQTNIDLYVEREKRLKPRWYDNKAIWFGGGILTSILIFQVVK